MDVSVFDDELGEHYWCDECDPNSHVVLLEAAVRGERPWEGRCKERLDAKAQYERIIRAVLEQVQWLWELYEVQPRAVAGEEGVVPPRRVAPAHYVETVKAAVRVLFEDLPMQSLRDLAQDLDSSDGTHRVIEMLRKKAAAEYGESDVDVLSILWSFSNGWTKVVSTVVNLRELLLLHDSSGAIVAYQELAGYLSIRLSTVSYRPLHCPIRLRRPGRLPIPLPPLLLLTSQHDNTNTKHNALWNSQDMLYHNACNYQ